MVNHLGNWRNGELGDFVTLKRGFDLPQQKREDGQVPIFSSSGITGTHSTAMVKAPGVITGRYGTIGEVFYAAEDFWPLNTTLFVEDFHGNDAKFIYYFLKTLEWSKFTSASAVPGINRNTVHKEIVSLPDIETQRRIASTLSMLDEKIKTNTEINDNLQQQAFSVFDNLIANAENNDCTVSDYAFLNPKRTLAKNQVARSIDMSQLSTSGAFPSGWEMKPFNGGMRFTNGDTLLARITPCLENGKTAFIDFLDDGEVAFGSTEYIVLAPKNDTPPEMLYCLARYPAFVDYAVKNMNGSSGRQRVSAETVGQYRLPLVDKHSLVLFKEVVSPMFLKMRYNSLENMRLAELRDALLPKLMSGEIDVSAVQL